MREDWSKIKHFTRDEFTCKCGCGLNNINFELVLLLDEARAEAAVPFMINSGSRCAKHNKKVGGAETSAHLSGMAADIKATNSKMQFLVIRACIKRFPRVGYNPRSGFVHVDIDPTKPSQVFFPY